MREEGPQEPPKFGSPPALSRIFTADQNADRISRVNPVLLLVPRWTWPSTEHTVGPVVPQEHSEEGRLEKHLSKPIKSLLHSMGYLGQAGFIPPLGTIVFESLNLFGFVVLKKKFFKGNLR